MQGVEALDLIGFFDPDEEVSKQVSKEFGLPAFPSAEALIDAAEAVDIVAPTTAHFELAKVAIEKGKHCFIEKPVTQTAEEAKALVALLQKHPVKVQIGHVERFNPAMLALKEKPLNPMFVEAHRLATFNPRGTDVSVVLDLMIHDLDLVLSLVNSPIQEVRASGVAIVSKSPDIANARIEFENGCVANLTASRFSMKQMRKLRLFQSDAYISMDFLEKNAQIIRMYEQGAPEAEKLDNLLKLETPAGTKLIHIDMPPAESVNAIQLELRHFADCILNDREPEVGLAAGSKAIEAAYWIMREMKGGKN